MSWFLCTPSQGVHGIHPYLLRRRLHNFLVLPSCTPDLEVPPIHCGHPCGQFLSVLGHFYLSFATHLTGILFLSPFSLQPF